MKQNLEVQVLKEFIDAVRIITNTDKKIGSVVVSFNGSRKPHIDISLPIIEVDRLIGNSTVNTEER